MNSSHDPKHTGEAPARRPADNEPEKVGEGELDEKSTPEAGDTAEENEEDEDLLGSDG